MPDDGLARQKATELSFGAMASKDSHLIKFGQHRLVKNSHALSAICYAIYAIRRMQYEPSHSGESRRFF